MTGQRAGRELGATDRLRDGDVVARSCVLHQGDWRRRSDDIGRAAVTTGSAVEGGGDGGGLALLERGGAGGREGGEDKGGGDGELHFGKGGFLDEELGLKLWLRVESRSD